MPIEDVYLAAIRPRLLISHQAVPHRIVLNIVPLRPIMLGGANFGVPKVALPESMPFAVGRFRATAFLSKGDPLGEAARPVVERRKGGHGRA